MTLTIEVDSGALLDLGHDGAITILRMDGPTVLSADGHGHWNLWDYSFASEIASGDLYCAPSCPPVNQREDHYADMAGGIVVIETQNGFEIRSATTGQVVSTITAAGSNWWSLASDGSYLAAGSSKGLSAWLTSGSSLLSLSGDYSSAVGFAAPGEIEVANGPAGQNVIQMTSVPGGTTTIGPAFNGQFSSWFLDDSRFIALAGTTALVYSPASVQQAAIALPAPGSGAPTIVGQGSWLWFRGSDGASLEVFPITTGSTPAASFPTDIDSAVVPSATTIGVSHLSTGVFSVIELSGTTPAETDYTLPMNSDGAPTYAASSASQWVLGNTWGVLIDGASLTGTPRYFDYGAAWSIAGSDGSIAVATASGRIVYFDATTLTQKGTISDLASTVRLSSDGTVLAAAGDMNDSQYHDDRSVKTYSLPSGSLAYTWPYSFSDGAGVYPEDIQLSATGTVLVQVLAENGRTVEASSPTGGPTIYSFSFTPAPLPVQTSVLVSPDGALIATSTTGQTTTAAANIYNNGSLATAVSGWPVGWIDDGHLLVNTYTQPHLDVVYAGCSVVGPAGQSAGSCALSTEVDALQPVTGDTICSNLRNSIFSVSTGSTVWTSGDPMSSQLIGAVAGNHVVFVSGAHILAQGY